MVALVSFRVVRFSQGVVAVATPRSTNAIPLNMVASFYMKEALKLSH
jgi:hypothetical protein